MWHRTQAVAQYDRFKSVWMFHFMCNVTLDIYDSRLVVCRFITRWTYFVISKTTSAIKADVFGAIEAIETKNIGKQNEKKKYRWINLFHNIVENVTSGQIYITINWQSGTLSDPRIRNTEWSKSMLRCFFDFVEWVNNAKEKR